MKTLAILVMLSAILSLFTGCAGKLLDQIPDGKADKVRYTRTGKFSSTTIEADGFDKDAERVKAKRLSAKHSNAWIPNVEFTAENYERVRKPEDTK